MHHYTREQLAAFWPLDRTQLQFDWTIYELSDVWYGRLECQYKDLRVLLDTTRSDSWLSGQAGSACYIDSFAISGPNVQDVGPSRYTKQKQTFPSITDALLFAENWIIDKYGTPMDLLVSGLAQPNPFRLNFQPGGNWTDVAKHGKYEICLRIGSVYIKYPAPETELMLLRSAIFELGESQRIWTGAMSSPWRQLDETPPRIAAQTKEEILDAVSAWFADRYLSPMDMLVGDLQSNPRYVRSNPFRLNFHYPSEVSSFTDVAERGNHEIRVQIDPYWDNKFTVHALLVTVQVNDRPARKILDKKYFGTVFKTRQEALDRVSDWYAESFLSPMDLLAEDLKSNPSRSRNPFHVKQYR